MTVKGKSNGGPVVGREDVLALAAARAVTRPLENRGKRRELDREALADWLRKESDPAKKARRCVRFILFQSKKDGDEGVSSAPIPKDCADREPHVEECVDKFHKTSTTIADASGPGLHHFYVSCYTTETNEDEQPQDQHHFVATASEEVLSLGAAAFGGVGSANEALGHSMRLFDTLIRQNADLMRTNADRYVDQLNHQNTLIKDMMAEGIGNFRQLQEALDQKALRDVEVQHKVMRLDAEYKAIGAAINYLLPLATHVLAQKTGFDPKVAAAQQAEGAGAQFLAAARTLKPQQVAALVLTLDEEQQEAFAPLILKMVEEWPAEKRGAFQEAMAAYQAPQIQPTEPAEGGDK